MARSGQFLPFLVILTIIAIRIIKAFVEAQKRRPGGDSSEGTDWTGPTPDAGPQAGDEWTDILLETPIPPAPPVPPRERPLMPPPVPLEETLEPVQPVAVKPLGPVAPSPTAATVATAAPQPLADEIARFVAASTPDATAVTAEVQSLMNQSLAAAMPRGPSPERRSRQARTAIGRRLGLVNRADVRRAFLWREILDRPRAFDV